MSKTEKYSNLLTVQKQFLCCTPVNLIDWKDTLNSISWEEQENLTSLTVKNSLVLQYPIKKSYQQSFLKYVINELESQTIEVHDEIYEFYCKLTALNDVDNKWFYKHYILDINDQSKKIITLKESSSFISEGTTGLCSWQASLALADYCIEHSSFIQDKSIIELGAGAGLLGLFLTALCNPRKYTFSDCHPSVLKLLTENILINVKQECSNFFDFPEYKIKNDSSFLEVNLNDYQCIKSFQNNVGNELVVLDLPWEKIGTCTVPACDLILAADVVYDPALLPFLCHCLNFLITTNKTCVALVACTVRNEETINEFIRQIESLDLVILKEPHVKSSWSSALTNTPVEIYKILNK